MPKPREGYHCFLAGKEAKNEPELWSNVWSNGSLCLAKDYETLHELTKGLPGKKPKTSKCEYLVSPDGKYARIVDVISCSDVELTRGIPTSRR